MQNAWLLGAGLAMALIWAIHTFLGGRDIARPLVRADLEDVVKWTQYYCWHLVTLTLAGLSLALIGGGLDARLTGAAGLAAILTTAFGIYGLILPRRVGLAYAVMPQGFLLLPVGLAGLWGLA
ncbi:MAG: hypothetical protein AAF366_19330 [Pseudomonadota bacterium]